MDTENIANVCHEANRAYCSNIGDHSQKPWAEAEEWQRASAKAGVEFAIANPGAHASTQHDAWVADKLRDGWVRGPLKDAQAKTHPCLVAYDDLPEAQRKKDSLFRAIVAALT